ncbi:hypothetical protein BT67DRAFT_435231 [Trichocladium antarcticum]|uniref:Disintegrin and metalloproteinase domain-containing protein B n=1 Tax=Trichocladium antarcticum TaxID=1450529 RepID=A0AAN6ZCK3_9PEZI|nr:hypothetical protein BT67DRAFT_435231 [Trichocladium antarcticum]
MILSKAVTAVILGAGFLHDAIAHSVKRNPLTSLTRIEDAVIQTPSHRVHAHTSFDVLFLLPDKQQKVRLSLEPNHDLFSGDATIQHLGADGSVRRIEPIDRAGHRVFKGDSFVQPDGESEWKHVGWTRINVHRDGETPIFDGVFTIHGDHHHVQTRTNYRQTTVTGDPEADNVEGEYMVVWRDSDIQASSHHDLKRDLEHGATCGSDKLVYNRDESNIVYRGLDELGQDTTPWQISPRSLFGRQLDTPGGNGAGVNLVSSIGSTAGCPTTRRVALIGIATDCTYTAKLGSEDAVTTNVIQLVNAASQLYESTFNISLAIQNLTISEAACPSTPPPSAPWNTPCSGGVDIEKRLSLFSQWRGQWTDTNAFWTLLSTCNTGDAVGLAWLGAVCQKGSTTRNDETSAGANVVIRTAAEWLVFAHETGHTFGAVHDCRGDSCSNGSVEKQQCCPLSSDTCDANARFIMNPSTGNGITQFSRCSIGNICSFLGRSPNRVSCLTSNRGVTTYTGAQCGNGIVEKGEECDCGDAEGCANNSCCDPKTCKYMQGSRCDPTNEECCTPQCGFMNNGTVCRASTGPCDPQEVCPGTSAGCPADKSTADGDSCGGDGLKCASGRCTSRDQQCKTFLAGTDTSGVSACSSSGCDLSCASARLGPQQCYVLQQWFLDGTPCEGGGKCYNGNCKGGSLSQQIAAWISDNPRIFYPVVCVVGGLLLIALISCCWSCIARRVRRRRSAAPPAPKYHQRGWSQQYFGAGGPSGGPPPLMRPGPAYAPVPMPPPQEGGRWQEPNRSGSYRYA